MKEYCTEITFSITKFLEFVYCLLFLKEQQFRNQIGFQSQAKKGGEYLLS